MSDDWGTMPGENYEIDTGVCPFCGSELNSRELCVDCDDAEYYCPNCGWVDCTD
jgi:predicted RNA-binding Zn-ribbon protein involved in translation (DUF1610 family)